ncbi:MAG: two-component regulator propeller domain-containing protein, partial [Bacteroidales bacterium]
MLKPDHLQRTIPLVFSGFITPRLMEKQLKTVRHLFDDSRACIGLFHLLVFVILIGCTMCMPVSGRSSAGIGPTLYPMGFRFTPYTVNEGLSQNLVSAVIEDDQGFIWIGTQQNFHLQQCEIRIFGSGPANPWIVIQILLFQYTWQV